MSFLSELEHTKELVEHMGKAEMEDVYRVLFGDEKTCLSVYREWMGTKDAQKTVGPMPLRANGGFRLGSAKVEGVLSRYTHCTPGHRLPGPQSTSSKAPESLAQAKEAFGGWGHYCHLTSQGQGRGGEWRHCRVNHEQPGQG